MRNTCRRAGHWIWIYLLTDMVFLFATWLIRPDSLKYMIPFLLLFTLAAVLAGAALDRTRSRKDEAEIRSFLEQPDEKAEELCTYFGHDPAVRMAVDEYLQMRRMVRETGGMMKDYEEYIEAWVHEVKTPVSMMELMLENRREEMTPYVYQRLHYAVHQLTEDAERILYYSRLHTEHPDFRIEPFSLSDCVRETVKSFEPFIREKKIRLSLALAPAEVVSDRRTICFLLSQLMSNAVKYADSEKGEILVSVRQEKDSVFLDICNNGPGVRAEDRPFLFDKGFTGSYPDRQKATGMGLFLVKKYAARLAVSVQLDEEIPFDTGFGITLIFSL